MLDMLFDGNTAFFTIPAFVGTFFFLLRLVMMAVGLGDHDMIPDADVHVAGDHHGDSTEAFKILSVQSIAAFLMGFGWGGLGALRGANWDWGVSLVVAVAAGIGMMWLLAMMLRGVYALQSSGNIAIDSAIGEQGTVYARVPRHGDGRGQVKLIIGGRQRIFNAVSDGEAIETNSTVRVTAVSADHTLRVTSA